LKSPGTSRTLKILDDVISIQWTVDGVGGVSCVRPKTYFKVTPVDDLAINPDRIEWNLFHKKWMSLDEKLKRVARCVGVSERYIIQKIGGRGGISRDDSTLKVFF
jgi:hypothetical protein